MENVVTAIFKVESEAYKAFTEIRQAPVADNYIVAEAALVKRGEKYIEVVESYDAVGLTTDDTATGLIVGSVVGLLGGPLGVLFGAGVGALVGSLFDEGDAIDSASLLKATSVKLYDGDVALIALVQEDEPAFDAAFAGYDVTIIRHFAADVMEEVERGRETEAEIAKLTREQDKAELKANKEAKRQKRVAKIQAYFDEAAADRAERKAEFKEAKDIANAQYVSATKETLGE